MLSTERPTIPILALDHDLVLSAWEEIGGDIFTCGDVLSPAAITLDLSDVEQSLKQSSSASLDHISNVSVVPNLFPSFSDLSAHGYGSGSLLTGFAPHDKQQPSCWGSQPQSYAMAPQAGHMPGLVGKDAQDANRSGGGGSSSSISSSSIDVAVVPEVSSQPAMPGLQGSPGNKVPQVYLQGMLPNVAPLPAGANRTPGEAEAWRTRRECLERYKEKKARRMYTKKIRYQLRKINADKRPRIKGRFVKKEELDEYMKGDVPFVAKAPEDEMSDLEEDDVMSEKEEPAQ